MKTLLTILCLLAFTSFGQNKTGMNCQVIQKPFIKKNGEATEHMEYYLRCSMGDYFIKLCEGTASEKQLKNYLNQAFPAEIEIREGLWDRCPDDPEEIQSRFGEYAVILSFNIDK